MVAGCEGLKPMDRLTGKSDPFVRIYLMPGCHKEQKTRVIKRNLNPVFDEIFKFLVSKERTSVMKKTLIFRVYDKDKLKCDELGEVFSLQILFKNDIFSCQDRYRFHYGSLI